MMALIEGFYVNHIIVNTCFEYYISLELTDITFNNSLDEVDKSCVLENISNLFH